MSSINFKNFSICLLIYSLPFLYFIQFNIDSLEVVLSKSFYLLIFFLLLILLFFASILNFFFKKINFSQSLFMIMIIYYFLFQHHRVKTFFFELQIDLFLKSFISEFVLVLLFFISIAVIFIYEKNRFIKNFIIIFFFLNFIASSYNILISLNIKNTHIDKMFSQKRDSVINDISPKFIKEKNNIYFIILDSMIPMKKFERSYDISLKKQYVFFQKHNFKVIDETVNPYDNTLHGLTSIFYLDYIFDSDNNLKSNIKNYFPTILKDEYNLPPLLQKLKKLEYDFKWAGNYFASCANTNIKLCLNLNQNQFIDLYLLVNFFKQSPTIQIANTIGKVIKFDVNKEILYELNNGIGRLMNFLEKNSPVDKLKPTFYFIHHMSPHYPYLTREDCSYKFTPGEINYEGYKSAYLCDLQRISEFINFIDKQDPNSFIIFQSDHGWIFEENDKKDKKKIFNLVRLNSKCELDHDINYNNVNILRLIFSCIDGQKAKYKLG